MRGLMLLNLGTPDAPTTSAVRRYLAQFLSDPRVLDINPIGRALLLHGIILRTRPAKSAHAYQQIWTDRGSPLLFHTQDLATKVQALLGQPWQVKVAMRYGSPAIGEVLAQFRQQGIDQLTVLPLFPQFATSSTGSGVAELYAQAGKLWNVPQVSILPAFFDDPSFISAWAEIGRRAISEFRPDHVLLSFHGLPERHMKKSDESGGAHCLVKDTCCDALTMANRNCYKAQCYATSRALASALNFSNDFYSVSFQSRLGRTPWIKPYTDSVLPALAKQGKKRLLVFCPAFVSDCLETLEEIGIRARDQWKASGGEELMLVPSLNSEDVWAKAVVDLLGKFNKLLPVV